jgi:hypothetical protein
VQWKVCYSKHFMRASSYMWIWTWFRFCILFTLHSTSLNGNLPPQPTSYLTFSFHSSSLLPCKHTKWTTHQQNNRPPFLPSWHAKRVQPICCPCCRPPHKHRLPVFWWYSQFWWSLNQRARSQLWSDWTGTRLLHTHINRRLDSNDGC